MLVSNSHFDRNSHGAVAIDANQTWFMPVRPWVLHTIFVNITSSSFRHNGHGGAVSIARANVFITNSSFIGNEASDRGGALYIAEVASLQIFNCVFRENLVSLEQAVAWNAKSDVFGGALYAYSECQQSPEYGCVIQLADTEFSGNLAGHKGALVDESTGAVHLDVNGYVITIMRCMFVGNNASTTGSIPGQYEVQHETLFDWKTSTGALHVGKFKDGFGSMVYLTNNSFIDNAAVIAGAVFLGGATCIAISNNTFESNNGTDAGALYILSPGGTPSECFQWGQRDVTPFENLPDGSTFFEPPSWGDDTLVSNLAGGAGIGNYYFKSTHGNVDIRGSTFSNNKAILHGALLVEGAQHPCLVSSSSFTGNMASAGNGGAVYMSGLGDLHVVASKFSSNFASTGGAVCFTSLSGVVTVKGSGFESNLAESEGGAIAVLVGSLAANDTTFVTNKAAFSGGGAVLCRDCLEVSINASSFLNNSAQEFGGALKVNRGAAKDVFLRGVNMMGNRYSTNCSVQLHA